MSPGPGNLQSPSSEGPPANAPGGSEGSPTNAPGPAKIFFLRRVPNPINGPVSNPTHQPVPPNLSPPLQGDQDPNANQPGSPRPWHRRKRTWLIAAGVLAIIGIVLGCVLGLVVFRPSADPATQPTGTGPATLPNGTSKCVRAVCIDGVATAVAPGDTLHLFARATDGSWKQATSAPGGGSYSGGWTPRGGSFDSAPRAIAWSVKSASAWGIGPTISLFGLSRDTKKLVAKHIGLATNTVTNFKDLSDPRNQSMEAPSLCNLGPNRIDVWLRVAGNNGGTLLHMYVDKESDMYERGYQTSDGGSLVAKSRYSVVCRDSVSVHDLVVYANGTGSSGLSAYHRQWNYNSGWTAWKDMGGSYAAGTHPVLLEVSSQRFDFFGLSSEGRLRRWSWSAGGGYTDTETLGAVEIVSVPAVALSGANKDRIEVVAVAKDGKLWRFSFGINDSALIGTWEELGVVSDSAPSLARVGSAVEMVTTAVDGSIWYATVTSDIKNWQNLAWKKIPGL